MGNSALKSHLETSQKTGVFQLTGKGLQEVRHDRSHLFTPVIMKSLCLQVNSEDICSYVSVPHGEIICFRHSTFIKVHSVKQVQPGRKEFLSLSGHRSQVCLSRYSFRIQVWLYSPV